MLRLIGPVLNAYINTYVYVYGKNTHQSQSAIFDQLMFYAVLFFYRWYEIMDEKPNTNEEWFLHRTVKTQNHLYALSLYAETPCPASVMLEAKTLKELNKEIEETKANYKNKEWLETNLYPFL